MQRKRICVITAHTESLYCQRVLSGIFDRCRMYGYDVAVFAQSAQVCDSYTEYLHGEKNIYGLINYNRFDGVIIIPLQLTEGNRTEIFDEIVHSLRTKCKLSVISLDKPIEGFETVFTDDRSVIKQVANHVIQEHKCRNIYFLSGEQESPISKDRTAGFTDALEENNLPVRDNAVFYGDFWYTGGAEFADRLATGEIPMPQAVICASDYIALGLINRLGTYGIKVPEDIIVTGFDAAEDSLLNNIAVTTAVPSVDLSAAEAVDRIRSVIEPDSLPAPVCDEKKDRVQIWDSCGCCGNRQSLKKHINPSHYYAERLHYYNLSNITLLMESNMLERLAGAHSPEDCLKEIYKATYLIRPYTNFYLCMRENWLDSDVSITEGYPEKMKTVVHTTPMPDSGFHSINGERFDTELMLPFLYEEREKPAVFYFSPIHFNREMLGYAVIQQNLDEYENISLIYRNWLRFVNNALEVARAKNQLSYISTHDAMTGCFNRRGMNQRVNNMLEISDNSLLMSVYVIDMDRLKYVNDVFGHSEGDFCIMSLSSAIRSILRNGEISVRAGGDEFFIIGVGAYSEEEEKERTEKLYEFLENFNACSGKPYTLSASIGRAAGKPACMEDFNKLLSAADAKMYAVKQKHKQISEG